MGQIHEGGNFASRLHAALLRSGMTQAALARAADVDQSSISRYLRGQCEPNLRQFQSIAYALGLKPSQLLPDDPAPPLAIVAARAEEGDGYCIFRDGQFVGRWHGRTLDIFPTARIADGKEARKLLDGVAHERSRGHRVDGKRRSKKG